MWDTRWHPRRIGHYSLHDMAIIVVIIPFFGCYLLKTVVPTKDTVPFDRTQPLNLPSTPQQKLPQIPLRLRSPKDRAHQYHVPDNIIVTPRQRTFGHGHAAGRTRAEPDIGRGLEGEEERVARSVGLGGEGGHLLEAGTAEEVSAGVRHVGLDENLHADGAGEFVQDVLLGSGPLLFDSLRAAFFLYPVLLPLLLFA